MGTATADVNNDGRIDLFASDMSGTNHFRRKVAMGDMQKDLWFLRVAEPPQYMRNALYLNTNAPRLMEVAKLAGVSNSDWTWSPLFGDLDNDGWVDLFVSNGMSRDFMDSDLSSKIRGKQSDAWLDQHILKERNLAFRNTGELKFEEVGEVWALDQLSASYGASLADLDRDGDLDLVVSNFDESPYVYDNQSSTNHRLLVRLVGTGSNRYGIGASVKIETANGKQTRWLASNQGLMSASEPIVHFGLGNQKRIERLTVTWPNGAVQDITNVDADQFYTITQDAALPTVDRTSRSQEESKKKTWFERSNLLVDLSHHEVEFDDFRVQPLLPSKLSQQGPGLAVADLNGDGKDDLFLSGAAGHPGRLIDGSRWRLLRPDVLPQTTGAEQLGSLLFDCDGDGDRDLYCVTGSVECDDDDPRLQDELYLNDGRGHFSLAPDAVPEFRESGSCVAAADYDRDGDLDLFVGGRLIPGQYPNSPPSRLLRNDGGRLVFAEGWLALGTSPIMRATGAVWSDVNNDGGSIFS